MYRATAVWALFLGLTGTTALAGAQQKKGTAAPFAVPGSADSASTGSKDPNARAHRRPAGNARDAALATFPGFRLLPDGRSRIYVELTKSVSVDERRAEGMIIYVIRGARVPVRNNRNALLTTHFATPVARARLLASGSDVELVIDLRKAVSATQKIVAAEAGAVRLEIDFPAGDYPPVPGLFEPPAAKDRASDTGDGDGNDAREPAASSPPKSPAPTTPAPNQGAAVPAPAGAKPR